MLNELELTGRARTHVVQMSEPRFAVQREVATAFLDMRADARLAGFDVRPYSSFRDFDAQLRIWNGKFSGKHLLYDRRGVALDRESFSSPKIIEHILNWSALPGGSRHQWGTEIDVIDAAAMPPRYVPKLLLEEVECDGMFVELHRWLDANIARYGFFRPYKAHRGGMYPEPWHLSYAALSVPTLSQMTPDLLAGALSGAEMLGKDDALVMLPVIFRDYILNISQPADQ